MIYPQNETGLAVVGEACGYQFKSSNMILRSGSAGGNGLASDIPDQSKVKQRAQLLAALRLGPVSTLEARERLGVLHAPGRVCELRKLGFKIATTARIEHDMEGRPHRVGVYTLTGGVR